MSPAGKCYIVIRSLGWPKRKPTISIGHEISGEPEADAWFAGVDVALRLSGWREVSPVDDTDYGKTALWEYSHQPDNYARLELRYERTP